MSCVKSTAYSVGYRPRQRESGRHKRAWQHIQRLLTQIRDKKQLQAVEDPHGGRHTQPRKVAQLLKEFLEGVMGGGGPGDVECDRYMISLPILPKVRRAMPLLMKPLTDEVTRAALEQLKQGSSAGIDGLPAELFQRFPEMFVPRMTQALHPFLTHGQ